MAATALSASAPNLDFYQFADLSSLRWGPGLLWGITGQVMLNHLAGDAMDPLRDFSEASRRELQMLYGR